MPVINRDLTMPVSLQVHSSSPTRSRGGILSDETEPEPGGRRSRARGPAQRPAQRWRPLSPGPRAARDRDSRSLRVADSEAGTIRLTQ
jgi:hypothetical protein